MSDNPGRNRYSEPTGQFSYPQALHIVPRERPSSRLPQRMLLKGCEVRRFKEKGNEKLEPTSPTII
jgi:hypothetical protein